LHISASAAVRQESAFRPVACRMDTLWAQIETLACDNPAPQ